MLGRTIRFFLENKLVTFILLFLLIGWGFSTAPFNWDTGLLPRDRVPVDAIPNLGKNQQIVHTTWKGRSPQDVEDQITYPLTTELLGVPGVEEIRSSSMFGVSYIYVIFEEGVDFYWSRTRILEKLNSLSSGTLPEGVQPALGPDATALGQIFWYTLEGRDSSGAATGGWDLHELRTIQDFQVKYALSSVKGVSEVASVGGHVKEYQVDIDPEAMRARGVTVTDIANAVRQSNLDVGARTMELNKAEYLVRGIGYIEDLEDLERTVVRSDEDHVPVRVEDVARVKFGPASRRGVIDKEGSEAVGGVVVARHGSNPMEVIEQVKAEIERISNGMPKKKLEDGTVSQLRIVPFYDRSELIDETLGTLEEALSLEVLITIIVIIVMVMELRASLLISSMLPIAVLICFIAMRYFGITANIVALSGIAIAIGTMVDMGIVISENIVKHLNRAPPDEDRLEVVFRGTNEVASAVITAVMTTIVSFLPVFTLQASEGKLFIPLAWTKTFALVAALVLSVLVIPALAHILFRIRVSRKGVRLAIALIAAILAFFLFFKLPWAGWIMFAIALANGGILFQNSLPERVRPWMRYWSVAVYSLVVTGLLAREWLPLGPEAGGLLNFLFVALLIYLLLAVFLFIIHVYPLVLNWCLEHKKSFLAIPLFFIFVGLLIWFGWGGLFGFVPEDAKDHYAWEQMEEHFPGLEKEFMPALDEGSFLLMPTTMPHSGIEENKEVLRKLDMAATAIPEVELVVGKLGRVESALDPAPINMFENIIDYKSEYKTDKNGRRQRFKVDENGDFVRDNSGSLIPDPNGEYFRQWRDHIQSPDDIWDEIVRVSKFPGLTSAPKLQPIQTRQIMLQSGMRAPLGLKIFGNDLDTIQEFAFELEERLKNVEGMKGSAVTADRIVGKPYLLVDLDRQALSRYGIPVEKAQRTIEVALGGMELERSVEGRERFPIRVRYPRELRENPEKISRILIPSGDGRNIPLGEVAELKYQKGPKTIKAENTFLSGNVLMDSEDGISGIEVVENAKDSIDEWIRSGSLVVPNGISYEFAGEYENQVRAEKRLSLVVPLSLAVIFLILYFQFRSVSTTSMIFSSILVAFAGGFLMIWLYGTDWFMNFSLFGQELREVFQVRSVNLSVAVWVGFIALFGIATDAAVVIATYLDQVFRREKPEDVQGVRKAVIEAGQQRVRPTLMTSATTILALLPILSSTGRGSDIMVPMAIPSFGGMLMALITLFVIPVLYGWREERKLKRNKKAIGNGDESETNGS